MMPVNMHIKLMFHQKVKCACNNMTLRISFNWYGISCFEKVVLKRVEMNARSINPLFHIWNNTPTPPHCLNPIATNPFSQSINSDPIAKSIHRQFHFQFTANCHFNSPFELVQCWTWIASHISTLTVLHKYNSRVTSEAWISGYAVMWCHRATRASFAHELQKIYMQYIFLQ